MYLSRWISILISNDNVTISPIRLYTVVHYPGVYIHSVHCVYVCERETRERESGEISGEIRGKR